MLRLADALAAKRARSSGRSSKSSGSARTSTLRCRGATFVHPLRGIIQLRISGACAAFGRYFPRRLCQKRGIYSCRHLSTSIARCAVCASVGDLPPRPPSPLPPSADPLSYAIMPGDSYSPPPTPTGPSRNPNPSSSRTHGATTSRSLPTVTLPPMDCALVASPPLRSCYAPHPPRSSSPPNLGCALVPSPPLSRCLKR